MPLAGGWVSGARADEDASRTVAAGGRAQARRFGLEFERRGIRVDEMRSSRWCRCLDTARLAFPRQAVEPLEALGSFFADGTAGGECTTALRDYLGSLPTERRVVLVQKSIALQSNGMDAQRLG